jgi:hypothetical protein
MRTMTASVQLKRNTGRGSPGVWRQYELIGGKVTLALALTLALTQSAESSPLQGS